jgi:hypothetical protein
MIANIHDGTFGDPPLFVIFAMFILYRVNKNKRTTPPQMNIFQKKRVKEIPRTFLDFVYFLWTNKPIQTPGASLKEFDWNTWSWQKQQQLPQQ